LELCAAMTKISLDDLLKRIEKLERSVFNGENAVKPVAPIKKITSEAPSNALPSHIVALKNEGFFKGVRTANEVHEKLQSRYSCSVDRIAMALLRLHRKKILRKTSKIVGKKSHIAYVW
jgi:hypothetical protein